MKTVSLPCQDMICNDESLDVDINFSVFASMKKNN